MVTRRCLIWSARAVSAGRTSTAKRARLPEVAGSASGALKWPRLALVSRSRVLSRTLCASSIRSQTTINSSTLATMRRCSARGGRGNSIRTILTLEMLGCAPPSLDARSLSRSDSKKRKRNRLKTRSNGVQPQTAWLVTARREKLRHGPVMADQIHEKGLQQPTADTLVFQQERDVEQRSVPLAFWLPELQSQLIGVT